MQKIKYDKVRQLDKIVFLALGLILVALVIQMAILNWINNRNISKMSEVLLDRVVNVIEKNEQGREGYDSFSERGLYCACQGSGLYYQCESGSRMKCLLL